MSTETVDGSRQKLPCEVTRKEFAGEMLGVQGRFRDLVRHKSDQENQRIRNQKWVSQQRFYEENGVQYSIQVCVRHDDELLNGHPSFSITAEIRGPRGFEAGGCCHGDIARHFPELAGLIKWHLCSTDGPLHYVENTLYLAGDRDCWGLRKGELRYRERLDHKVTHGCDIPAKYDWQEKYRRPDEGEEHVEGAVRRWLPISMIDPESDADAVSYTHLTLPTKRIV